MQILQWLSKLAQKQSAEDKKAKSKEIVVFIGSDGVRRRRFKRVEKSKLNLKNYSSLFCFLQRKDVPKASFYHTLNLRRIGSLSRRKMKKEFAHKADSKVLPITDHSAQTASSRNINHDQCPRSDKKEKAKGVSRMKELMKWAATAKGEKRGKKHDIGRKDIFQTKNKAVLKVVQDGDQFSNGSPKISFRWDGMQGCSVTSSISAVSRASSLKNGGDECVGRIGNWITTDSEFVVLEL